MSTSAVRQKFDRPSWRWRTAVGARAAGVGLDVSRSGKGAARGTSQEARLAVRVLALLLGTATMGCLELREDELDAKQDSCTACHGDGRRSGDELERSAPPHDLDGNTSAKEPGVGAHARHAVGTGYASVACAQCHVVPKNVFSPGHVDSPAPAEVSFGNLARQGNRNPRYDAKGATCSDTYCHGAASVTWTDARSPDAACGTCHGLPPAPPHPQNENCSLCHGDVIGKGREFVASTRHVDGTIDVRLPSDCAACHGRDPAKGAPPPDLRGNWESSAVGVGAHAVHLDSSATHGPVACVDCHRVPSETTSEGHIDEDGRAEVVMGGLATKNGAQPTYETELGTCSSSYCHGSRSGVWQSPRASADACGSCHGLPPPPPHAQNNACSNCHGRVIDAAGNIRDPGLHVDGSVQLDCGGCHALPPPRPHPQRTECSRCHGAVIDAARAFVAPELHGNGIVELSPMACNSCHGADASGIPPADLLGGSNVNERGVGAHANHAQPSTTHAAIACGECHQIPLVWDSPGHIDADGRAEITFGTLARANGRSPTYVDSTLTCAGNYCHGDASPNWVAPRSSVDACGTCHALPPPLPHPQRDDCSRCHGSVVDAQRAFLRPELHVDGLVQVTQSCSSCHGSNANAAPPIDVSGSQEPTRIGNGTHQTHLRGGNFSRPLACSECHEVPTTVDAAGHLDLGAFDPADVRFSGPATANASNPVWDRASATCTGSYCHGLRDPTKASPSWVAAPAVQACTACHGMPPPAPHTTITQCSFCHVDVDTTNTITDRSLHVNGRVDLR